MLVALAAQAQGPPAGPPPQELNEVGTTAARVGLNGMVLDSAGVSVRGAIVRAIPKGGEHALPVSQRTNHETRTDTLGSFYLPLVGGSYELRVERAGIVRVSVQVFVRKNGAKCVVLGFTSPRRSLSEGRTCVRP